MTAVVAALAACGRARGGTAPDAAPPPDAPVVRPVATPSIRCSECHERIRIEWQASAHARSAAGAVYRAARADAPSPAACDRCHAPLPAEDPAATEGVTCDVCHTARDLTPGPGGAPLTLHLEDTVKYGPLCDARDHYFHKMGCSPLHEESRFCAACHALRVGDLPVFTEYEEWAGSAYAEGGVECQSCHMPGAVAEVAVGSTTRVGVPHHGFLGRDGGLRARALAASVRVEPQGGALVVFVRLTNARAGHAVPTGLPGRRIVLRVRVVGADGAERARAERAYERTLMDAAGRPAPFWRAVRVARDTRLAAKEVREERFAFAGGASAVIVELVRQPLGEGLGGLPAAPEERLGAVRVPVRGGGPRTAELAP